MNNKEKVLAEFPEIIFERYKHPRVVVRCRVIEEKLKKMQPVALCAN